MEQVWGVAPPATRGPAVVLDAASVWPTSAMRAFTLLQELHPRRRGDWRGADGGGRGRHHPLRALQHLGAGGAVASRAGGHLPGATAGGLGRCSGGAGAGALASCEAQLWRGRAARLSTAAGAGGSAQRLRVRPRMPGWPCPPAHGQVRPGADCGGHGRLGLPGGYRQGVHAPAARQVSAPAHNALLPAEAPGISRRYALSRPAFLPARAGCGA